MVSGAELIFYNLDSIKGEKACIITEGEIDCMTLHECGFYNAVSVPNGASKGNQKLEYLDNCWEYFEAVEKVVLAVDNDEAGISLRDELARRLGFDKCWTVKYPDGCKDANEVLVKHGKQAVIELIHGAQEWPIRGVVSTEAMIPSLDEWYYNGYPKGGKAHIKGFDELLTFAPGQITTVTGIPGHGKDEFMNWIMANLAKYEGWNIAVCGFEESPEETASKLIEKLMGKAFGYRIDPSNRITQEEYHTGLGLVDQYFSIINPDEIETDIDSLLSVATGLVKKRGIRVLYLNPWNWIEHTRDKSMSETEYVSHVYTKMIRWARKYAVHIFLLAHTTKMMKAKDGRKYEIPTLYSISGSANFYNKTHNGFTVFRDTETNMADVYVQKVKQSWLGKIGFASFNYNTMTRQYIPVGSIESWMPINDN
jgi:twinkle protein